MAGREVLDAACGVGYGIEILAAAGAAAVTGVDLDPATVAEARARFGDHAKEIVEADLGALPFGDDSFDVAVSFETIEHVEDGERALAELRRVLRPDGVLIVSSPNPHVYLGGNEHHVHEYRPQELAVAVAEHFANVALYRQDAWAGSTVQPEDGDPGLEETLRTSDPGAAGEPTYGIVVGSEGELPQLGAVLAVGDAFDVRWWSQQLAQAKGDAALLQKRLEETATALLDASQELAQIPLLRHRLAELEQLHADLSEQYHQMLGSKSWRITAPLRRANRSG